MSRNIFSFTLPLLVRLLAALHPIIAFSHNLPSLAKLSSASQPFRPAWKSLGGNFVCFQSGLTASMSSEANTDSINRRTGVRCRGADARLCSHCLRPHRVCICASLPRELMETKLEIVILQHPKEKKKKTYGTVPILQLCLKNVRVLQGNFTMPEGGDETTSSIAREKHVYHALALNFESQLQLGVELDTKNTVVLFPDLEQDDIFLLKHPELKDRRAINLGLRGPESEEGLLADVKHLIVIDGTWAQAKSMYRSCSFLHRFRRVQFAGGLTGKYIFRKEPKHNYLSTLESIAHCLPFLERPPADGEALSSALIRAFTAMVTNQLQFIPDRETPVIE